MKIFEIARDFLREFDLDNAVYEKMTTQEILNAIINLQLDEEVKVLLMREIAANIDVVHAVTVDITKLSLLELVDYINSQLQVNMTLKFSRKLKEIAPLKLSDIMHLTIDELCYRKERLNG